MILQGGSGVMGVTGGVMREIWGSEKNTRKLKGVKYKENPREIQPQNARYVVHGGSRGYGGATGTTPARCTAVPGSPSMFRMFRSVQEARADEYVTPRSPTEFLRPPPPILTRVQGGSFTVALALMCGRISEGGPGPRRR